MVVRVLLAAAAFPVLAAVATPVMAAPPVPRLAVGDLLPPIQGDLLSGKEAALPGAARGSVALLALGFSYDSRFAVEEWARRFRAAYGPGKDATLFEVPMMGTAARMGRWFIDRGMRKNTPADLHDRVLTVYGSTGDWKQRLGVTDDRFAYLVLVDRTGHVAWMYAGMFDAARFDSLRAAVDAQLAR